jgi:hypothetical protein
MKYPQLILLPLLMLSDYFLTILGAVQKEKGYSNHFKTEYYELNPVWQESIVRKRWLNPRHILLTFLVSCVLAGALESANFPVPLAEGLFGYLFVFFGMIVGRHLSNILIFRRFARRPDEISGQVAMAHSLVLAVSTYQYLVAAVPVTIIAIFRPTPFTLGGLAASITVFVLHFVWILRNRKRAPNPKGGVKGSQPVR